MLAGTGVTVSLLIGELAFTDPVLADEVKVAVLAGSLIAAVAGVLLRRATASTGSCGKRRLSGRHRQLT